MASCPIGHVQEASHSAKSTNWAKAFDVIRIMLLSATDGGIVEQVVQMQIREVQLERVTWTRPSLRALTISYAIVVFPSAIDRARSG